jgi:hypothetical protein
MIDDLSCVHGQRQRDCRTAIFAAIQNVGQNGPPTNVSARVNAGIFICAAKLDIDNWL